MIRQDKSSEQYRRHVQLNIDAIKGIIKNLDKEDSADINFQMKLENQVDPKASATMIPTMMLHMRR